ncbi:MAG: hypothetical protein ACTSPD_09800 [Promethearchaeota archaeon]
MDFNKEELQEKIIKIRNLHQYKGKSEEELETIAKRLLIKANNKKQKKQTEKKEESVPVINPDDSEWLIIFDKEEQEQAQKLFNSYKENCHVERLSETNLLKDLVFLEILSNRYKKQINEKSKKDENTKEKKIPTHLIRAFHDNVDKIMTMKDKLFGSKDENDPYKFIALLMKKFKLWRKKNQLTRFRICPHCHKAIQLQLRAEYWDAIKHPWFRDRFLYNEHLFDLYFLGKIKKEDVAKILQGKNVKSTDYVDLIIEKVKNMRAQENVTDVTGQ